MARRVRRGFSPNINETKGSYKVKVSSSQKGKTTLSEKIATQPVPIKRGPSDKKLSTVPKALPPLDDPDLPPTPQLLSSKLAVNATAVTWDIETSSDSLGAAIDAIGAYCPLEKVDKDGMFVSRVATQGTCKNQAAGDHVNWQCGYELWTNDEKQCLESFVKWLTNISGRKYNSRGCGDVATDGAVLLSVGGIAARIPKLFLAFRRHKLLPQLENAVIGICDVNALALEADPSIPNGADVEVYRSDPAVQSRHFYKVLAGKQRSEMKLIACNRHPLAKNIFSPSYVMKLSAWRFKTDHRAIDLRAIVTTRVGKGVKRKRSLIKNLLAVGYDYGSLQKQYQAFGEFVFREVLLNKLRHMKQYRESNLTDTREVGCKTIIESVINHFKEVQRERTLKRAPPLD